MFVFDTASLDTRQPDPIQFDTKRVEAVAKELLDVGEFKNNLARKVQELVQKSALKSDD